MPTNAGKEIADEEFLLVDNLPPNVFKEIHCDCPVIEVPTGEQLGKELSPPENTRVSIFNIVQLECPRHHVRSREFVSHETNVTKT